jgi:hypothetical protein
METPATGGHSRHMADTPAYKGYTFHGPDSTHDTLAYETTKILNLTGAETDEQDIDGEYDEDDQTEITTLQVNEYSATEQDTNRMKFKVKDAATFSAAVGGAKEDVDTPPPSEVNSPAMNVPAPNQNKQKLVLKLPTLSKLKTAVSKRTSSPRVDSLTTEAPVTTKSGRKSKARKTYDDTLEGEDYDAYMGSVTSVDRVARDEHVPSSLPPVPPKNGLGRLRKQFSAPTPVDDTFYSSSTLGRDEEEDDFSAALNEGFANAFQGDTAGHKSNNKRTTHPFAAKILPGIQQLVNKLAAQDPVPVNLPKNNSGEWTAEELMHMYISAYKSRHWHICDVIADTWIRAFQSVNKSGKPIWRANKGNWVYQAKNPENFGLDTEDPALDRQVCAFEAKLLNNLYHHTGKDCGARMLWADSMALCGRDWEQELTSRARRTNKWHDDLLWNTMCTALRMVRCKLTLKIEEATEGAWCKRYHMHLLHDQPCYREIARDAAAPGSGQKRGAEETEWESRKRVEFAKAHNGDDDVLSEEE